MRPRLVLALFFLSALLTLPLASAQDVVLKVTGQALDDRGQPIPGVTVRLAVPDGDEIMRVTTDPRGHYAFPSESLDMMDLVVAVSEWPSAYTPAGPEEVTISLSTDNPEVITNFSFTGPPAETSPADTPPDDTPPADTPPADTPPPPQTADDSGPIWPYMLVALAVLAGAAYLFLRSRPPAKQAAVPVNLLDQFLQQRDAQAWSEMYKTWEQTAPAMQQMPMVQQQRAFALNRDGRGDEAEKALQGMLAEHGASTETNGILARVYKDRWLAARNASQAERAAELLDLALHTYLAGHEADPSHPYPGLNALTLMEFYNPPPERRAALLSEVSAAAQAMPQDNAYWDHATRLELAVLAGEESAARTALADAVAAKRVAWEIETTLNNLSLIRTAREERGEPLPAWISDIETALKTAMNGA